MRLLILGGTRFLSRATALAALERGHEVVVACRGLSGPVPEGARLVRWDRDGPAPAALLAAGPFDAVVDVARTPAHVGRALDVLAHLPWILVSTISVYRDVADPGGPGVGALHPPLLDGDPAAGSDVYGGLKIACEQAVQQRAASATILRPGLIVGPGDPTGRFTYWAARRERRGVVLAPGEASDPVQVIDVRDHASWIVDLAERPVAVVLDAVGPVLGMGEFVAACVPHARPVWVPHHDLLAAGLSPWAGPDAIGAWLPRPEYDGMLAHDPAPAAAAGLRCRPLAETAADTAAWLRADPDAPLTGITADRELALLDEV